ncbi:MAG: GIY-YIG nuclease family protein [bacterium]
MKSKKCGRSSTGYPPVPNVGTFGRGASSNKNMYVVYVLQDDKGKIYKGFTNNLARRFSEHLRGKTKTTSRMGKLKIIYTKEYNTQDDARTRELYLKSAAGRRFLKCRCGRSSTG